MTKTQFNKILNSCRNKTKTRLDIAKISALPEKTKTAIVLHIVKYRGPILKEFMTPAIDQSWLACCGYMYQTKGAKSRLVFIHTCEHVIR